MHPLFAAFSNELVKLGAPFSRLTPESSNVRGYRYDVGAKALFVTFKNGGTYRYNDVPPAVAKSLGRNKSVGKTINRLVKGKGYSYEKVGAPKALMNEVVHALKIRTIRGSARDVGVREFLEHVKPPPIPKAALRRRGNILAPIAGEIDTLTKKAGSAHEFFHVVKESPLIDIMADEVVERGLTALVHSGGAESRRRRHVHHKHASSIESYFDQTWRSIDKIAGVAKKQMTFDGLRVKVEHGPGDVRTGKSKDGKTWERKMFASYGYLPGTKGLAADGDAIDVYVAAEPLEGKPVFEVRQNKREGGYDESKFMIGWPDANSAKAAYLQHMPEWAFGSIAKSAATPRDFGAQILHMNPMKKVAEPQPLPPISLALKLQGVRSAHARGEAPAPGLVPPPKTNPPKMNPTPSVATPAPKIKPPTPTSMGKTSALLRGFADELGKTAAVTPVAKKIGAHKGSMNSTKNRWSKQAGFLDEMVKGAGLRDMIRRIVDGKPPHIGKLGFFERRRLAKTLGVRAADVERTMMQRQRTARLSRGTQMLGAGAIGALAGSKLSRESSDE